MTGSLEVNFQILIGMCKRVCKHPSLSTQGGVKMAIPSKRDWKLYQEKIKEWQEHYIEKLVKEYADYLCSEIPASTKFWELEKRIKQDKKNPGVLIELSRSDMLWDIVGLIRRNIITIEDLVEFSDELKEEVTLILQRSIE